MTSIKFLGASEQVTGSMFLVKFDDKSLLVDCGLNFDTQLDAKPFDFDAEHIDYIVLTHAHLDHSGLIPALVKSGFEGIIFCTYATFHLTSELLYDNARINTRKNKPNRRIKSKANYTLNDVKASLDFFETVNFNEPILLWDEIEVTFKVAGHLLGAAHVLFKYIDNAIEKSLVFSGDIGRSNYPLLSDPEVVTSADYLVCESTYGNRKRQENSTPDVLIESVIREACVDISGRLIIPAFSIGRTQTLLFLLHRLQVNGKLPSIQVFTDSPLAKKTTSIYNDFVPFLNAEAQKFYQDNGALFDFPNLTYLEDMNSADEIDQYNQPCIIITSSGMVRGGKSEEHIIRNLNNSYCTILFVGYCSPGTLGRRLVDGLKSYRYNDDELQVHAKVVATDVLSGHADFDELVSFVENQDKSKLRKIMLTHGDPDALDNFQSTLVQRGFSDVVVPVPGAEIVLD